MIDEPPLLTVRAGFARPAADAVAAFAGVPTGWIVDCLGGRGALDYRIKPVDPERAAFAGVALTCNVGAADNLAVFAALAEARPGDVILCATDAFTATAVIGDLVAGMARNVGAAAFVTDGLVRDAAGIRKTQLPVFAAGVSPNSPSRLGPGSIGLPIVLGSVGAEAGDLVVGDADGVVVVPQRDIPLVLERLPAVREKEARMDAAVAAGLRLPDFVRPLLASDRVRRIG